REIGEFMQTQNERKSDSLLQKELEDAEKLYLVLSADLKTVSENYKTAKDELHEMKGLDSRVLEAQYRAKQLKERKDALQKEVNAVLKKKIQFESAIKAQNVN
ncbi:MAG: hypothetical protein IKM68_08590, partial [Bacteroidaceae bacterium]|nr:hypothetical protein [Bacteroidaceae bacterium]